jgi:hypothetical protein
MASIGSFGAAVRQLDPDAPRDTFDFFGETFTVHDIIPPMLMLQLGAAMTGKVGEVEGNGAMWEALRCSLTAPARDGERADDSQFDRFYRLAVDKQCATDELIKLVLALIGAQADLPTERQPTSPDGRPPISESSNSSSSDTPGLVSVEDRLAGLS